MIFSSYSHKDSHTDSKYRIDDHPQRQRALSQDGVLSYMEPVGVSLPESNIAMENPQFIDDFPNKSPFIDYFPIKVPVLAVANHVCSRSVYHDSLHPGAGPIAGRATSCSRSARVAAGR